MLILLFDEETYTINKRTPPIISDLGGVASLFVPKFLYMKILIPYKKTTKNLKEEGGNFLCMMR